MLEDWIFGKRTDGGTSWTKISSWATSTAGFYVHADQHNIQWWDGGSKLLFGCDGGLHFSTNGGTTNEHRNKGLRMKQFYSVAIHPNETNYFLAGAQDNGMHRLNHPGLDSSIEVTGGDGAYCAIDQNEPQFQFGSYVFNSYRRSVNNGATWSSPINNQSTGRFINPWDYDNTGNIVYACNTTGTYFRWNNPQTGTTNEVVTATGFTGNVSAVHVSPYTANRVYFGMGNGGIQYVDNANTGTTVTATNITPSGSSGYVNCVVTGSSDQNLLATYSSYGVNNVWVSTNGGTSWTAIDGNLPDMPVRWALFHPDVNTKAYIATETGVWETDLINGASTVWTANSTFPNVRTDMIKYRASDRTIAAGTHGRGVWTTTIPSVGPPTVTINQAVGQADPTSTSPINFTVVFSEPVTGFTTGDVTLSGTAGATTGTVTGSGATYNVAVSGMTSSGTVIATIMAGVATGTINVLGNAASTSTDNTVTYNVPAVPPTVTINQAVGQADPTSTSPINFTVVFSEPVTGFITGDVTLSGTAGATTGTVTGSGATYNVAVSGMTGSGTVIASINAGVATGTVNVTGNAASTSTDNTVTFNLIVGCPTITSTTPGSACGPGPVSVVLSATSSIPSTFNWYDMPVGGTLLGNGSPFNTPPINSNTTFYVSATAGGSTTTNVGLPAKITGTSGAGTTNFGLVFDALATFTLNSVVVYPVSTVAGTAGTVTIDVINSAGTVVHTATVNVIGNPTASVTPQTVPLNFTIAPGTNYKLRPGSRGPGITGLIFEPSASAPSGNYGYPFTIPGVLSINHSTLTAAPTNTTRLDLYYYFYNWSVTHGSGGGGCESARTAVTASIVAPPAVFNVTGGGTTCAGGTVLVGLDGSETGVNYQLVLNGSTNVGAPLAGTGAALDFGNQTTTGTYTVLATNTTTTCSIIMTGNAIVTINTPPAVVTNPMNTSVPNTGNTSLIASFSGSPTPGLQWEVSTTGPGGPWIPLTNATPYSGVTTGTLNINPASIGMDGNYYHCVATNICAPSATTTAALLTVTLGPTSSVLTLVGPSPICSGATSNLAVTITGGVSPYTVVYTNGTTNFTVNNYVSGTNIPVSPTVTTTYSLVSITDAGMNPGVGNSGMPTVLVNPTPNAVATPSSQNACSGSAITPIVLTGSVAGTTYTWTRDNTVTVTGIAASGSGNITGVLNNTTGAAVTVTFTITPTANGCTGPTTTATVVVNPVPSVDNIPNQTVCNGTMTAPVNFTGPIAGTIFTWSNNTPSIGLAASGVGNIPAFTATNATTTPVTATVTVTPQIAQPGPVVFTGSLDAGDPTLTAGRINRNAVASSCAVPKTFPGTFGTGPYYYDLYTLINTTGAAQCVTVSYSSTTTNQVHVTAYNGSFNPANIATNYIADGGSSSAGAPVNFTFTAPAGATIVFHVFEPNISQVCPGYNVTITGLTQNCSGPSKTFDITVNPTPTITCPANITRASTVGACNVAVTYTPTVTGTPTPTLSYSFSGATTGSGSGTGSGSLFNVGVTTVTVTATNTCATVSCTFTITVTDSQLPVINTQPANRTVCAGNSATFSVAAVTAPSTGGPLNYQWQMWTGSAWSNIAGATSSSYTVANTTRSMNTNSFRVNVIGLCTTVPSTFATLYVNALPTINLTTSIPPNLLPTQVLTITATAIPGGGTYVWRKNGVVIAGASGTTLSGLSVSDIGTYSVVYTDGNGCSSTSSSIEVTAQSSDNMYVYPVPNDGRFIVRFYNQSNEQVTIRVIDTKGAEVYNRKIQTTIPYSTINVDLTTSRAFANGVYVVEIRKADGSLAGTRRIIVFKE